MALEVCAFENSALLYQILEDGLVLSKKRTSVGINHAVDVSLHLGLLDAFEVVAHAHVEDEIGILGLAGECRLDEMDGEPGLQILVIGLLKRVLGGPFHVVAFVTGVDAGLGDLQMVHDLDSLEFHEPAADHIGTDDVLGELRMRTCRRSQRSGALLSEDLNGMLSVRLEEILLVDPENAAVVAVFLENPSDQFLEWNGTHSITHKNSPCL